MVYVLDKNDPLNCEIPHTDWTNLSFTKIPKTVTVCETCVKEITLEGNDGV